MTTDARQPENVRRAESSVTRRTVLALVAAWGLPGMGHIFLGRTRRGLLFSFLILSSFALGLFHDGRLALRDARQPYLSTLQVLANVGVGPVDFLARWIVYGEPAYGLPRDEAYPDYAERIKILRDRSRSSLSIYGTAYLWTAGLMNLMLLFEVWDIGMGRRA